MRLKFPKKKTKKDKSKFEKVFGTFAESDPTYYKIALEYKPRLSTKNITILSLTDRVYSDYIKITKSDANGICTCITSGVRMKRDSPQMQNWHFSKRGKMKYRFMDINCRPQSLNDNMWKDGNYPRYTLFMSKILWSVEKAVEMFEDKETVHISEAEKIEMSKKRYLKIQERKSELGKTNK